MNENIFKMRIINEFIPYINAIMIAHHLELELQHSVLIIDNAPSHHFDELNEMSQQNKFEILSLFPNTTHLMQPLDLSPFGIMENEYFNAHTDHKCYDKAFPQKMDHIIASYRKASSEMNIISSWEKACIDSICNDIMKHIKQKI